MQNRLSISLFILTLSDVTQQADQPEYLLNQNLFFLLQLLHKLQRHLERLRNDIRRRQCKPLRERNIGHAIRLVYLDPDEIFRL